MSSRRFTWFFRSLVVLGTTAMLSTTASAVVESSCPAPCLVPPKTTLFVRESGGTLGVGGHIYLPGTLLKGARKTVLRVDASFVVDVDNTMYNLWLDPTLNGVDTGMLHTTVCESSRANFCTITATYWWDIDALEAAYPGSFVGQPLNIMLEGGNMFGEGAGLPYQASFSAEIVKKK